MIKKMAFINVFQFFTLILQPQAKDSYAKRIDNPAEVVSLIETRGISLRVSNKKILQKKNAGIPNAYTFGRAKDGSAWIFFYEQTLGSMAYLRDKLFYNKLGQALCVLKGLDYLGSDSGIYQKKENFVLLRGQFLPNVQKEIAKQCHFDQTFHQLGEEVAERRHRHWIRRNAFNVGNGQGVIFHPHANTADINKHIGIIMKNLVAYSKKVRDAAKKNQKKNRKKSAIVPIPIKTAAGVVNVDPQYFSALPVHTIYIPGNIGLPKIVPQTNLVPQTNPLALPQGA